MKNNKLLSIAGVAIALLASANAATISGSGIVDVGGGDTLILGITGSKVASGIASSGYFTITDAQVATLSSTYSTAPGSVDGIAARSSLISAFVGLANDDFVTGGTVTFGGAIPGVYTLTADLGLLGTSYAGLNKVLYTFFGDGADLSSSAGLGLALHTGVTLDRDDNVATPDSNDIGLGIPYQALIRGATTATTYDPSQIFGEPTAPISAGAFQLVGVPEPSAALLGALGALGLLRRRRI
ncbi:MAG: hypothetical protein Q8Q59_12325 [Luteolibacter sp.]|nr:hypothetical protein [Luteolibacter sp.]